MPVRVGSAEVPAQRVGNRREGAGPAGLRNTAAFSVAVKKFLAVMPAPAVEHPEAIGDDHVPALKSFRRLKHQRVETGVGIVFQKHAGQDVARARRKEILVGSCP